MTEQALRGEAALVTDQALAVAGSAACGPAVHSAVLAWINEVKRSFGEAEERLGLAAVVPGLSSLAAVPLLQRSILGRRNRHSTSAFGSCHSHSVLSPANVLRSVAGAAP